MDCAFGVLSKNLSSSPRSQRFSSVFSLHLNHSFCIRCEVYVEVCLQLHGSPIAPALFVESLTSFFGFLLYFCKESFGHVSVGLTPNWFLQLLSLIHLCILTPVPHYPATIQKIFISGTVILPTLFF